MTSNDNEDMIKEKEDRTNKLASQKFAYMTRTFHPHRTTPRYSSEVVGISSAFNLLRTRKRTRRIIYDKWNAIRKRRSKGRRKRLSNRFNQYFFRDKSISKIFNSVDTDNSGSIDFNEYKLALQSTGLRSYSDESIKLSFEEMDADGNGEISKSEFQLAVQKMRNKSSSGQGDDKIAIENDIIDDVEEEDDEDDTATLKSLDAMRAKSGVLRTRIRLRQESLAALERLIRDVKIEMRRNGWPYKSSAAVVEDAFPSTAITYTETGEVVQDMGIKQDINKVSLLLICGSVCQTV